jgi:hypothetical protein
MNEMIKNFKEAQIARRQFGEKKIKMNKSNKILKQQTDFMNKTKT